MLHDDALDYLRREARDWSEWKLVANLPYSVASPILVELAQAERGPRRMVATLQIEVAKRLMARAGRAGLRRAHPAGPARLRTAEVVQDSRQLLLPGAGRGFGLRMPGAPRAAAAPAGTAGHVHQIVKRSFSQRRKMMLKLLKEDWPEPRLATEFERLKLSPQVRAEEVSLEQFAQIAQSSVSADSDMTEEIFDVVNERDEVIGQQPRSEVHRLGLMHRAVHVLVFNAARAGVSAKALA